jgi:excisionase family DNA binding protein
LTLTDAAARLGVTPDTLRQQIARGRLEGVKHGRDWWIEPDEVERYRRDVAGKPGPQKKEVRDD